MFRFFQRQGGAALEGIFNKHVWFIPPGDYYFHDLDLRSGNAAIVMLTHLGSIRFWVDEGGTGNQSDRMQTVVVFTSTDPSRFRLFYNKCEDLLIAGGSNFYGGFYAVRDGCSDDTPKVDFTGNTRQFTARSWLRTSISVAVLASFFRTMALAPIRLTIRSGLASKTAGAK